MDTETFTLDRTPDLILASPRSIMPVEDKPMRAGYRAVLIYSLLIASAAHAQTGNSALNAPALFEKGMNALVGSSATGSGPGALTYFHSSAELGFDPAQVVLGYFYEMGRNTTPDPQQALDWYKKAARQDDPLAQWLAGRLIALGVPDRDLNEAASWLEKSGNPEDPFAEYLLGKIFMERGDYSHAAAWFRKAALQGLPQSQHHFALLLRDGQGVSADKPGAYVWMLASYDSGFCSAGQDLQALEAELSSHELELAKAELVRWKARLREASLDGAVPAGAANLTKFQPRLRQTFSDSVGNPGNGK